MLNIYFKISVINKAFILGHVGNVNEFEKLPAEKRLELLEDENNPFRFDLWFISDISKLRIASRGFNDITISDIAISHPHNKKPIFTFKKFLPQRPLDPIVVMETIEFTRNGKELAIRLQEILNTQ